MNMAKQLTYPQIIRNMIESAVRDYIRNRNQRWADIGKVNLEKSDFGIPSINYSVDVTIEYNNYTVHGWMDEYGRAYVSCVTFKRVKADPDTEWWKPENQHTVHRFLHGKELEEFTFAE